MTRNHNRTGDAAELEAAAFFLRQGYVVSFPHSTAPYDMVVDRGFDLVRIEVKSTTQNGRVKRDCKNWGWTVIVDASKPFDFLYVHTPDLHYLIPHSELGDVRKGLMVPTRADLPSNSKWLRFVLGPVNSLDW
jgi:hypothetical protein